MGTSAVDVVDDRIVRDTDADTTPENDVGSGPCTLLGVHVVNPVAGVMHLKFWDSLAPSHGTTEPKSVVYVPASEELSRTFGNGAGLRFPTGLSFACSDSTGPGKTAGSNPSSDVTVRLRLRRG